MTLEFNFYCNIYNLEVPIIEKENNNNKNNRKA